MRFYFSAGCRACLVIIHFHGKPRRARVTVQLLSSHADILRSFVLTQLAFCYWLASCLLVTVFIVRDGRFSMTTMLPNQSPEPSAVGLYTVLQKKVNHS